MCLRCCVDHYFEFFFMLGFDTDRSHSNKVQSTKYNVLYVIVVVITASLVIYTFLIIFAPKIECNCVCVCECECVYLKLDLGAQLE